jgi:NAD+ synthase (glutamine-hydrolysing)
LNTSKLTIALAQCNFLLGDLKGNAQKILDQAKRASFSGAQVLVTPELSLTGYPPEDLLLREAFLTDVDQQLEILREELAQFKELYVVVGHPQRHKINQEIKLFNQATVFCNGQLCLLLQTAIT